MRTICNQNIICNSLFLAAQKEQLKLKSERERKREGKNVNSLVNLEYVVDANALLCLCGINLIHH